MEPVTELPTTLPPARPANHRWILVAIAFTAPVLAIFAFAAWFGSAAFSESLRGLSFSLAGFGRVLMGEFFTSPWFYVVVVAVLALEWLVPARAGQKLFSVGVRHDLLWVGLKLLTTGWLLPAYILALRWAFDNYLGFLRIDAAASLPWVARFLLAWLWGDFLFWAIHYVRHKVSVLWHFHAVHHSQRELNFFTEYRVHPFDDLIAITIGFIPVLMIAHSAVTVLAIAWLGHFHNRVCHSNLRTNFGWLRYVLVTPQSHRVHHSIERRHFDKNFGLTFSIWDHLFGTQHRGYDEYPETGIPEEEFPYEQKAGSPMWASFVGQLVYPFQAIARQRD